MALKYQEVAKDLAHKIFNKAYTDKLPSEGELLEEYEVSRNTIRTHLEFFITKDLLNGFKEVVTLSHSHFTIIQQL